MFCLFGVNFNLIIILILRYTNKGKRVSNRQVSNRNRNKTHKTRRHNHHKRKRNLRGGERKEGIIKNCIGKDDLPPMVKKVNGMIATKENLKIMLNMAKEDQYRKI